VNWLARFLGSVTLENVVAAFCIAVLVSCFVLALAGCGGGSEEEDRTATPKVDCLANPELCK